MTKANLHWKCTWTKTSKHAPSLLRAPRGTQLSACSFMSFFQVSFEDDFLSCRSQSQTNINFPMEEMDRRTLTQTSLLTASPQKYVGSTSPDYSSLRRQPYSILRNHHLSPQHNGHLGSINSTKTPFINGTSAAYTSPRRSPYNSPSSGAWSPSPMPPPYPRSSMNNSRMLAGEGRDNSRSNSVAISSDAKLMFTPGSKMISGATYL